MAFVIGRGVLLVGKTLLTNVYVGKMSIYGIKQFSVCCHGSNFNMAAKPTFCFTHCIHQPNLSFMALMILELCRMVFFKYPKTSLSNNKSKNLNKRHCLRGIKRLVPATHKIFCSDTQSNNFRKLHCKHVIMIAGIATPSHRQCNGFEQIVLPCELMLEYPLVKKLDTRNGTVLC